jgi:hypothetical protein
MCFTVLICFVDHFIAFHPIAFVNVLYFSIISVWQQQPTRQERALQQPGKWAVDLSI